MLTLGSNGWSYDGHSKGKGVGSMPNDVLLCELSGAKSLWANGKPRDLVPFATVVVDARCSSFPSSTCSVDPSGNGEESKKRKAGAFQENDHSYGEAVAEELYSSEWWNGIIEHLLDKHTKCAVLETSGVVEGHAYLTDQKALLPHTKEKTDILSFKVAFLYHQLFQSKRKTFGRRAFWWAKKHYIALKKESSGADKSGVDLSSGVKGILMKLMKEVSYSPDVSTEELEDIVSSTIPKWAVQTCTLSLSQRAAYDSACLFVRGAFHARGDTDLISPDAHLSSAKALLRLRRACFHSDLHESVSAARASSFPDSKRMQAKSSSHLSGSMQDGTSCSQTNISLAKSLLEKSSKLRQLLSILCKDCGFDVPAKNFLLDTKPSKRGRKSSSGKRKKVLILATLPEVLVLISSFLNATGIAHELLTPPSCITGPSHTGIQDTSPPSAESVLSWIHCQQSIGRFDDSLPDADSSKSSMSVNVLVSSPNSLASTSLGLSASNAEVVISVDEDWSGGSDLLMYSILRKNRTKNMQKATGRKYIKLIAEHTCEQSFLTFDKKTRGKKSVQALPMMMTSLKYSILDHNGCLMPTSRSILGKNMLRYTGVPLRHVFCADTLPMGALFGGTNLFLAAPCADSEEYREDKDDSDLTQYADKVPVLLDDSDDEPSYIERVGGVQSAISFGRALSKIERVSSMALVISCKSSSDLGDPYDPTALGNASSHISACRDVCSKQIQRYITLTKLRPSHTEAAGVKNGNISKSIPEAIQMEKSIQQASSRKLYASSQDQSPLQIGSTRSKPEEIASSLIWYACNINENKKTEDNAKETEDAQESNKRRTNSYVRSYMSIKRNFDGNQGCESLVYFPPLFPGLMQTKNRNEIELNPLDQSFLNSNQISLTKKRKNLTDNQNSKKLRGAIPYSTSGLDFPMGVPSVTPSQPYPNSSLLSKDMASDLNLMAVSDLDFMDSANDLFDGDFLPDLNITSDEEVVNEVPKSDVIEDTTKSSLDEDFGILGPGLLPPLEDSSKAAMKYNGYSNLYSYWLDPFEPLLSTEDYSCNGPSLDSIILHVKKSTKPAVGGMHRKISGMSAPSSSSLASSAGIASSNGGFDSYKKHNSFLPNSSFEPTKVDSLPSSVHAGLISKDPKRRDISSVFDSFAHCGAPSIRVHHNLQDLLGPSGNQMVSGGVIPPNNHISLGSSHCSIRELLPDENTGDIAKSIAKAQSESFCRDSLISFGVDFGPFSVSILPEATAKVRSNSIDDRTGVRLPMGVKVPKSMSAFSKNLDVWTKVEDDLLKFYATRYSCNWHAVSQALTRKSRVSTCLDTETIMNPIRSAKQCNDRWDSIKPTTTSSVKDEATSAPVLEKENSELGAKQQDKVEPDFSQGLMLIDKRHFADAKAMGAHDAQETGRIVNRMQKLKKASLKRHHVPLTIPGYTSGSNMPSLQIVPSHPSHSQSVQAAIAASAGPSGIVPPRAEMWPLQFLDLTEKQLQQVEKMKASSAVQSQVPLQQVMPVRQAHPPPRQSSVPNPGVPRAATHAPPPRPIPSGQPPPQMMPRTQQQVLQPQIQPGPSTNPGGNPGGNR